MFKKRILINVIVIDYYNQCVLKNVWAKVERSTVIFYGKFILFCKTKQTNGSLLEQNTVSISPLLLKFTTTVVPILQANALGVDNHFSFGIPVAIHLYHLIHTGPKNLVIVFSSYGSLGISRLPGKNYAYIDLPWRSHLSRRLVSFPGASPPDP